MQGGPPKPTTMNPLIKSPYVIDLSHHNWPGSVDFKFLFNQGVRGVIAKATEGIEIKDPKFEHYYESARSAGMLFGAYHFANNSDHQAQLANYRDVTKGKSILHALDWEWSINQAPPTFVLDWDTFFYAGHHDRPYLLYKPLSWKDPVESPGYQSKNWVPEYSQHLTAEHWHLWQFSEHGLQVLPTNGTKGTYIPYDIDVSVWNHLRGDLAAWWKTMEVVL